MEGLDLLVAIKEGDAQRVKELLEAGADPNACGKSGKTALMSATYNGNVKIAKLLLDAGADPDIQGEEFGSGMTALMMAIGKVGSMDCSKTGGNFAQCVRLLLAAGADPNIADFGGETALMHAVSENNPVAAKLLTCAGADPNFERKIAEPETNIIAEEEQEKGGVIPSFLRVAQRDGKSAFRMAVRWNYVECMPELIKGGAKPDIRGNDEASALVDAAFRGDADAAIAALLKKGCSANGQVENGWTALIASALSAMPKQRGFCLMRGPILTFKIRTATLPSCGRLKPLTRNALIFFWRAAPTPTRKGGAAARRSCWP